MKIVTRCGAELKSDERSFCLVPDCDEQPYPGDELCQSHQQEDAVSCAAAEHDLAVLPHAYLVTGEDE